MYKIRRVMLLLGCVNLACYAQQHEVNLDTITSGSKPVIINTDNPPVRIDLELPPIDDNTVAYTIVGNATVTGRVESQVYLEFAPPVGAEKCTDHDICSYPNTEGGSTLKLSMETLNNGQEQPVLHKRPCGFALPRQTRLDHSQVLSLVSKTLPTGLSFLATVSNKRL